MRVIAIDLNRRGSRSVKALRSAGHAVDHLIEVASAIELASAAAVDLVLLEADASASVAAVVRRIRRERIVTPLLVRLIRHDDEAVTGCLTEGADDCIWHKASDNELVARVTGLISRSRGLTSTVVDLGPVHVDLTHRCATVDNVHLPLTRKEYAVLEALTLRRGHVLNRRTIADLLSEGWPHTNPAVVNVFICKLRQKLRKATGAGGIIRTEWGRGYSLPAPPRVQV